MLFFFAILPEAEQSRVLAKGVAAARKLTTGDVVMAQKKPLVKELQAATAMMEDILDHRGPSSIEAAKLSDFATLVLKKSENYLRVTVADDDVATTSGRRTLFGADAIKHLVEKMSNSKNVHENEDLQTVRSFKWMLSSKELKLFTEWERAAVVSARDTMMATKRQAIKDLEENLETGKPQKTLQKEVAAPPLKEKRMASASSVSLANAAKKASMMAKPEEEDETTSNTPTGLMSFFGSKAL